MKKQAIFDKSAKHLLKQDAKAMNKHGRCVFRADNGLQCAVGCLIKDKEYKEKMEGKLISQLIDLKLLPKRLREHPNLLESLRKVHDNWPPDKWKYQLGNVANDYGLKIKVLR